MSKQGFQSCNTTLVGEELEGCRNMSGIRRCSLLIIQKYAKQVEIDVKAASKLTVEGQARSQQERAVHSNPQFNNISLFRDS